MVAPFVDAIFDDVFNGLTKWLQTFINASMLNFIQALGDSVLSLFNGLTGGMIEYMFRLMFGEQCKSYLFVYIVGSEIVVL